MKRMIIITGVTIALLAIAGVVFRSYTITTTHQSTTIIGDLTIKEGEVRTIANGATLRVSGNLLVKGTLECSENIPAQGPLLVETGGTLTINGTLRCVSGEETINASGRGIALKAKNIIMSNTASIITNGNLEIVTNEKQLLEPEDVIPFFSNIEQSEEQATAIGPLRAEEELTEYQALPSPSSSPDSILAGEWHIGDTQALTPKRGEMPRTIPSHPIIRVDLEGNSVRIADLTIKGAHGRSGADAEGSCTANGTDGGDAGRLFLRAKELAIDAMQLELGKGGRGGNATTQGTCKNALARGGDGGRSGNFKLLAERIALTRLTINSGGGGAGGDATAKGENRGATETCAGENGGNADATGGRGGGDLRALHISGNITGAESIAITRAQGGAGGNALAQGGKGSEASNCGCSGGNGGNARAIGGEGGDARVTLMGKNGESHGGDGGDGDTEGGAGGSGGSCSTDKQGGEGGRGGDARSIGGDGGQGYTRTGGPGEAHTVGGAGGDGGEGCPPGAGALGGIGAPNGARGKEGVHRCPTSTPEPKPAPTPQPTVKAILYRGHYLPETQLRITTSTGCTDPHWRPLDHTVTATDGTTIEDPITPCGFGKASDVPLSNVPNIYFVGTSTPPFED